MKLKTRWIPPVMAAVVRAYGRSWRVRDGWEPATHPRRPRPRSRRLVYALWHRTVLMNTYLFRDLGACAGVSEHEDGELAARTSQHMGFHTARGSSTRGSTRL